MKKITTMVVALLVATMSIGGITIYAAETKEAPRKIERPALAENFKNFKADFDFDIEKIKSGEFNFEGMKDKVFEKVGNLKQGKFSFEAKEFQGRKNKPENLTEEQKTALLEKVKEKVGENAFADKFPRKFRGVKKFGKCMMNKAVEEATDDM